MTTQSTDTTTSKTWQDYIDAQADISVQDDDEFVVVNDGQDEYRVPKAVWERAMQLPWRRDDNPADEYENLANDLDKCGWTH